MTAAATQSAVTESQASNLSSIRPMRSGELGYVLHSWAEGFKGSPTMRRKLWKDFKALDAPKLAEALKRSDARVLIAASDTDWPIGWIAFAPWRSIDAVHWVHVHMRSRRAGIAAALFNAAGLKKRIVYTHQAEAKRGGKERADQWLSRWLAARGHIVSYTPYQEWAR